VDSFLTQEITTATTIITKIAIEKHTVEMQEEIWPAKRDFSLQ